MRVRFECAQRFVKREPELQARPDQVPYGKTHLFSEKSGAMTREPGGRDQLTLERNKMFGMVEICLVCGNGPDHCKVVRVMSRLGFLTHPTSHHEHMLGG